MTTYVSPCFAGDAPVLLVWQGWRRSRIARECDNLCGAISRGDRYFRVVCVYGGEISARAYCQRCAGET